VVEQLRYFGGDGDETFHLCGARRPSTPRQGSRGAHGIADEFEGPDGRIHWRDSRLEWPIRHGFIEAVAKEYQAGKMMFPPDAT
jgi:hypothetical protein